MIYVIVVAAGRGSRFGGDLPKQYCMLGDRPVLVHTVQRFAKVFPEAKICVVLHPDFRAHWEDLAERYGLKTTVAYGGSTRWESVKNAIETLDVEDDAVVMVHDGARPIVPEDMLSGIMTVLEHCDATIPVIPVTDSLRELRSTNYELRQSDLGDMKESWAVDRSRLVAVQTPQAFRGDKIKAAYKLPYQSSFTDDASVYEAAGYGSPMLVEGSPLNIKITNPMDIAVAEVYMKSEK